MKKQAIALVFANGINFLVNFAMTPFLARQLSYQDNGTYGQINLINGFAAIVFGLGISSVINLLLAEVKGQEKSLISAGFWIQTLSAVVCVLFIGLFSSPVAVLFNNSQLASYLVQYLPSTFLMILSNLAIYYYIYYNKTYQLSFITVLTNILKIAAVYYAVNFLKSLYYVILFINIVSVLQIVVHSWFLRRQLFPIFKPDFSKIKYVLNLSLPYMGMSIIGYSILYANGIIVSNQMGITEFAIYRNGAIEIPFIATLYASISAVALPKIVELTRSGNFKDLMALKRKISSSVAAMIYPVVFFCIFNGQIFIELYLGEKYIQSGIIFCIYNLAVLIRINSYTDILTISKKPFKIVIPNIMSLVAGLIGTYLLISMMGVKGAAVSYVISIFILCIFLINNTCTQLGIKLFEYFDFKVIGKIILVSIIAALISMLFVKVNTFSFLLVGCIYMFSVYFFLLKLKLIDVGLLPAPLKAFLQKFKLV